VDGADGAATEASLERAVEPAQQEAAVEAADTTSLGTTAPLATRWRSASTIQPVRPVFFTKENTRDQRRIGALMAITAMLAARAAAAVVPKTAWGAPHRQRAAKVAMAAHSTTGVPSRRGRTKMRRKTYPPLRERHDRHPAGNAACPAGRHESHNRDFRPAGRQNGNIQV